MSYHRRMASLGKTTTPKTDIKTGDGTIADSDINSINSLIQTPHTAPTGGPYGTNSFGSNPFGPTSGNDSVGFDGLKSSWGTSSNTTTFGFGGSSFGDFGKTFATDLQTEHDGKDQQFSGFQSTSTGMGFGDFTGIGIGVKSENEQDIKRDLGKFVNFGEIRDKNAPPTQTKPKPMQVNLQDTEDADWDDDLDEENNKDDNQDKDSGHHVSQKGNSMDGNKGSDFFSSIEQHAHAETGIENLFDPLKGLSVGDQIKSADEKSGEHITNEKPPTEKNENAIIGMNKEDKIEVQGTVQGSETVNNLLGGMSFGKQLYHGADEKQSETGSNDEQPKNDYKVQLQDTEDPPEDAWDDEEEEIMTEKDKKEVVGNTVETNKNVHHVDQVTTNHVDPTESKGNFDSPVKSNTEAHMDHQEIITPEKLEPVIEQVHKEVSPVAFSQSPESQLHFNTKDLPPLQFNVLDKDGFKVPLDRRPRPGPPREKSPIISESPPQVTSPISAPDIGRVHSQKNDYSKYPKLMQNEVELVKKLKSCDQAMQDKLNQIENRRESALNELKKKHEEKCRAIELKYQSKY
jgi:hypothetical protein